MCLARDDGCYAVWQNVYPNFIAQSSNLVLYITENWDRLSIDRRKAASSKSQGKKNSKQTLVVPPLDPAKVLEAVQFFLSVNKQIQEGTYKPPPGTKKGKLVRVI